MKRILFAGAAVAALGFGITMAQACPGVASTLTSSTVAQPADTVVRTDISSAKKKKKMSSRKGGGASKAGTGGGAGGESGSGATSDTQQGKPRGTPAVR
jgi:hypothetical protein